MTLRALRSQHKHAVKMRRITRLRGWERAVARLNREIMQRVRPLRPSRSARGGER